MANGSQLAGDGVFSVITFCDSEMRWEPSSYDGAKATESEPQRALEFGRWNTSAPSEARLPSVSGRASSPMLRQQHKR